MLPPRGVFDDPVQRRAQNAARRRRAAEWRRGGRHGEGAYAVVVAVAMTVTSLEEGRRSERGRWKKLEWREVPGAWGEELEEGGRGWREG